MLGCFRNRHDRKCFDPGRSWDPLCLLVAFFFIFGQIIAQCDLISLFAATYRLIFFSILYF